MLILCLLIRLMDWVQVGNGVFTDEMEKTKLWGATPKWDQLPISAELLGAVKNAGVKKIIWGGNFYELPPSRCWFVWDKLQSNRGADFEMAWTNLDLAPKCFRMSRIDAYHNKAMFKKKHGAEKPVQLFQFCLQYVPNCESVIDCFCGTGNSLVACRLAGIPAVGIDLSPVYCAEAIRRIKTIKIK